MPELVRDCGFDIGNGSKKANANYEFSDKKQTNFATIGEGNIIINDTETDLTKLNRDVTISQYNTKEGGLAGGFTIDSATVDFITSPIDTVTGTVNSLKQGYEDAKETTGKIVDEAGVAVEKTVNCYKSVNEGDGLTLENQEERLDRLADKLLSDNKYMLYAEGFGEGEVQDGQAGSGNDKLALITDPGKMGQGSKALKEILGEVFDEIREDDSDMLKTINQLEELKEGYSKKAENLWKQLDQDGTIYGDHELTEDEFKNLSKEDKNLYLNVQKYAKLSNKAYENYEDQTLIHDYILTEDRDKLITTTASKICNVEAYWEYGSVTDKEDRTFKGFYKEELNKGLIGSVDSEGNANAYYGKGGNIWANQYNLTDSYKGENIGTKAKPEYLPLNVDQSNIILDNNKTGYAIIWKEKDDEGQPTHFSTIKKGDDGIWYDYDHNRKKKPEEVDLTKVYKITQESEIKEKSK